MDNAIQEYVAQLKKDVGEGLMSEHELEKTLKSLGIETEQKKPSITTIRPAFRELEIDTLYRFNDLFFRELFGRPEQEDDYQMEGLHTLVAERGNSVIAVSDFAIEPNRAYDGCIYIDKVVVDQRFRQEGIASLLLYQVCDNTYDQAAINKVVLHAPRAVYGFYHRNGFFTDGRTCEKEGVEMKKFTLPFTMQAYQELCRTGIEPFDFKGAEKQMSLLDSAIVQGNTTFDFDKNPFLNLLRGNLPGAGTYRIKTQYGSE